MLSETAFFPGGSGLWLGDSGSWYMASDRPDMPKGKVMILGHNFGSEAGYIEIMSLGVQRELDSPTWRHLLELLQSVDIPSEDCFFRNAFMGLIKGERSTGEFPGASDQVFLRRCRSFLDKQIEVQKTRLILTLGRFVPRFIEPLSPHLAAWRGYETFRELDASGPLIPLITDVRFKGSGEQSVAVVALVHPSMRGENVWRRHYRGLSGEDAELRMLKDAWARYKEAHHAL